MTGASAGADAAKEKEKEKEKKRALPSEFERQVEQIRTDMKTVRDNLDAAERVLADSTARAAAPPAAPPAAGAPAAYAQAPQLAPLAAPGQSTDSLLAPAPAGSDHLMPDAQTGGLE